MLNKKRNHQKGMAIIEMIPVIVVIALLLNYSLGFFGVIHSGILNSIAARNYSFETFRNRSNFVALRDTGRGQETLYAKYASRYHGIVSETTRSETDFDATLRHISFNKQGPKDDEVSVGARRESSFGKIASGEKMEKTDDDLNASPVWVRTGYGICLNAKCSQ